jgi:hypothetical protein
MPHGRSGEGWWEKIMTKWDPSMLIINVTGRLLDGLPICTICILCGHIIDIVLSITTAGGLRIRTQILLYICKRLKGR